MLMTLSNTVTILLLMFNTYFTFRTQSFLLQNLIEKINKDDVSSFSFFLSFFLSLLLNSDADEKNDFYITEYYRFVRPRHY